MSIIIVDADDVQIGVKLRTELLDSDKIRVSALWLTNSRGEILLQQRSFSKKSDPGKWSVAVAGTVEDGETYESNMVKEIEEEIGLTNLVLEKGPKLLNQKTNNFVQFFFAQSDAPLSALRFPPDEVFALRWFTKEEIACLIVEEPEMFTSGFRRYFNAFSDRKTNG